MRPDCRQNPRSAEDAVRAVEPHRGGAADRAALRRGAGGAHDGAVSEALGFHATEADEESLRAVADGGAPLVADAVPDDCRTRPGRRGRDSLGRRERTAQRRRARPQLRSQGSDPGRARQPQAARPVGHQHGHQQGADALEDLRRRPECPDPDRLPAPPDQGAAAQAVPDPGQPAGASRQAGEGLAGAARPGQVPADGPRLRSTVVSGADHFFHDLYGEDAADAIDAFLRR